MDAFFNQVSALAVAAGDPNTPSISVTEATGGTRGVKLVAVDLTLAGTYGQMTSFLQGLDSFPRLFSVTSLTINGGPVATGGAAVNPATDGLPLTLQGNIFYSTGQNNVCAATTTRTRTEAQLRAGSCAVIGRLKELRPGADSCPDSHCASREEVHAQVHAHASA